MPAFRHRLLALLLVLVPAAACGPSTPPPNDPAVLDSEDRGGTVEPTTEAERQLLAELGKLAPGKPQTVGSLTVTAGAPYHAASGRKCRSFEVTGSADKTRDGSRLACTEGREWFFVPSIFVSPTASP